MIVGGGLFSGKPAVCIGSSHVSTSPSQVILDSDADEKMYSEKKMGRVL